MTNNPSPTVGSLTAAPRRKNRRVRLFRFLPYVGLTVLVVGIVAGLWPKPVPVEVASVTEGPLQVAVSEEGKTRIQHRFTVSAPVAGQLRRIPFKAGAEVQAGRTVLAVIDPVAPGLLDERARRFAEARRDSAAANLEKARAAHRFAQSELARFKNLFEQQTISAQELEGVQLREASAAKDLEAGEAQLRQAEAELADFDHAAGGQNPGGRAPVEVLSPATGQVLRVVEENARVVGPGTPLMEVGDPTELEVVIDVLSRDGAAMKPGMRVELSQWGGPGLLSAQVRLIEPAAFTKISALGVEEQRVNVVADLLTPREERRSLGDHFRVEARILIWETEQALKVPAGALFRKGDQWFTFVLEAGRARARAVQVGRSSGTETQVLGGLSAGETVVLYPGSRVRDGQRLTRIEI